MLLLDTHALIWFVIGVELKPMAARIIEAEAARSRVCVSAASAWEIPHIIRKGDLVVDGDGWTWFQNATVKRGLTLVDLTSELAWQSCHLPGELRRDPADRFLVATARKLDARLATRDGKLIAYAESGHLRVLPC